MTRPPARPAPAPLPPDEADLLAAEYAIGVLDAAARAEAELRLGADPAFAAAVAAWTARLSPLDAPTPPVPPPDLLPRIEARLFGAPAPRARRAWWQGWLAGAAAAALAAAAAIWLSMNGPPTGPVTGPVAEPVPVARVAGASGAVFAVAWDAGARTLTARLAEGPAPAAGRAYQLWAIAPGRPPVSVGVLGAEGLRTTWDDPAGLLFAVSVEPAGGSPTGLPTGPVIAAGFADL